MSPDTSPDLSLIPSSLTYTPSTPHPRIHNNSWVLANGVVLVSQYTGAEQIVHIIDL